MGQWEPLADRVPVDMRRLATQLRRMKDRSGLTVPALAARTAQSAEVWSQALAGLQLPPLDAVEVLAQASGADYDRIGALWQLAEKADTGTGDRGRGKQVPYPDPLDPLSPEEGLPGRRRPFWLLAVAGVLAAATLVVVLTLTAGTGTGRAPAERNAGPSASGPAAASAAPVGDTPRGSRHGGSGTGGSGGSTSRDAAAVDPGAPAVAATVTSGPPATAGTVSPPAGTTTAPGTTAPGGGPTATVSTAPGGPPTTGPPASSAPATPPPSATPSKLCVQVIVLGVCLG